MNQVADGLTRPLPGQQSPLMVRADNGRTPTAETHSGGPKHGYMTNGERAGFATKPCFKLVNGIAHADGTRPRRMTGTFWDVLPAKAYGNELFCTMPATKSRATTAPQKQDTKQKATSGPQNRRRRWAQNIIQRIFGRWRDGDREVFLLLIYATLCCY